MHVLLGIAIVAGLVALTVAQVKLGKWSRNKSRAEDEQYDRETGRDDPKS